MESSFEYQKHLIESLARSERATRRKYYELQMAIEGRGTDEDFDVVISTSSVTPTRVRDLETPENHSSELKNKLLIGELLLCFQLLNELLRSHMAISKDTEGSPTIYKEFNSHLEKLNQTELQRLKKEHGDTSMFMMVAAARNLQTRLGELVNASGSVTKRAVIGTNGQMEQPRLSMENSRPAIFYALDESQSSGRIGEPTSDDLFFSIVERPQDDCLRRMQISVDDPPRKRLWHRVLENITRKDTTSGRASHNTGPSPSKLSGLAPKRRESLPSEDEDEDENMTESIVQNLLFEWTNLPSQE